MTDGKKAYRESFARPNLKRLSALVATFGAFANAQLQAHQTTIIAESGQSIEGVAGAFESFSSPGLDDAGNVIFAANLDTLDAGTNEAFESIVWVPANGDATIAKTGDSAPHATGSTLFEFFSPPELDPAGTIAFRATVNTFLNNQEPIGIWTTSSADPNALTFVARGGSPAPKDHGAPAVDNGVFKYLGTPNLDHASSIWFYADLSDQTSGIWSKGIGADSLLLAAIKEESLGGETVAETLSYAANGSETGWVLVSSKDPNTSELPRRALFATSKGNAPLSIVEVGDPLPGSTNPIASIGAPAKLADNSVVFWVGTADSQQSEGLYSYANGAIAAILPVDGSLNISGEEIHYDVVSNPIANGSGSISAILTDLSAEIPISYIVFKKSGSVDWKILGQTGQQAPGAIAGTLFESFSTPLMAPNGAVAFTANLTGTGDAISDTTDSGIFATDPNDFTSIVAREGDTLNLSSGLATITSLEVTDINQSAEIVARYALANGASSIVKIAIESTAPPVITSDISDTDVFQGATLRLAVVVEGAAPLSYQWKKDGEPIEAATNPQLEITLVEASDAGEYAVDVSSPFGNAASAAAQVAVNPAPAIPLFVEQPVDTNSPRGSSVSLDGLAVAEEGVTYQWFKTDALIEGATSSSLSIQVSSVLDSGNYYVVATSPAGTTTSDEIRLVITDGRLVNLSTRALVGTDANNLIAGFAVEGTEPKELLIRAVGPTLSNFDVPGVLEEPRIELFRNGESLFENSGWNQIQNKQPIIDAGIIVGAFPLQPTSEDAILLVTLDPGLYSAVVSGENGTTGIALVEAYEVANNLERLTNISSRAFVGVGDDVAIPGFVIEGNNSSTVLVRAIGPGLAKFDVAGVLERPIIQVFNQDGQVIASNNAWEENANVDAIIDMQGKVGAFPLESGSQDAALLIELVPGSYSIAVSGEASTTGVALIEVYEAK